MLDCHCDEAEKALYSTVANLQLFVNLYAEVSTFFLSFTIYMQLLIVCVYLCVRTCVDVIWINHGCVIICFVLCVGAIGSSKWQLFRRKSGFSLSKGLKAILDESSHGPIEVAGVYGHVFSHFRSFEKDVSCSD